MCEYIFICSFIPFCLLEYLIRKINPTEQCTQFELLIGLFLIVTASPIIYFADVNTLQIHPSPDGDLESLVSFCCILFSL